MVFLTFGFGGKLNVLKSFSFRKKQKEIKIFPLLQNWRLFQENLQFYVTKNQNRRKTEQKEIKGPLRWPPRKFDLSRRFIYWQNERCLLLGSVHLENLKANQRQLIIPSYNSYEICYIARYIRTIRCDNSFHLQINAYDVEHRYIIEFHNFLMFGLVLYLNQI